MGLGAGLGVGLGVGAGAGVRACRRPNLFISHVCCCCGHAATWAGVGAPRGGDVNEIYTVCEECVSALGGCVGPAHFVSLRASIKEWRARVFTYPRN